MKIASVGFSLILAAIWSSPAVAQKEETVADVRCLLVGIQMSNSRDANQRASGALVAMYYLGRLDRIVPARDLESLIAKEASEMVGAKFQSETARCGRSLTEKGQVLQKIGSDLSVHGQ